VLARESIWIHGWGLSIGSIPGATHGEGKFDGESFWVGCGWFVSWGDRGRGRGTPGQVLLRNFRRTTRVPNSPFLCYILFIEKWRFHYIMCQTIANGVLESRYPGQTRVLFKFRQPDDLFHTLKTLSSVKALTVFGYLSGRIDSVRIYGSVYERYTPNIYRYIHT
jgi:hypothetical protein